jgi:hypothetical protein
MNNLNDNITFFLEEKKTNQEYDESEIQKMLNELEDDLDDVLEDELDVFIPNDNNDYNNDHNFMYFNDKNFYGNDELYYNQEYTVKELLKICNYYGIEKDIKTSKCKKQDIISTLIYFENSPENFEIVKKRNKMWAYIREITDDPKMKKYVIWN